jgi:hypothetical protein
VDDGARAGLLSRLEQHDQDDGQNGDGEDQEGYGSGAAASLAHWCWHGGFGLVVTGLVVGRSCGATLSIVGWEGGHRRHPVVVVERLPPASVL